MTEGDLPAPLVPPDCDLRGYEFMPLFGHRLFNGEFYMRASDAGFRAGLRLMWAAWQQTPAASLPDDDFLLCRMADFGRDLRAWKAVREEALAGWIKCSDGRLYHPELAEQALDKWERRQKARDKKARQRGQKRDGEGDTTGDNPGLSPSGPPSGPRSVPPSVPGDKGGSVPGDTGDVSPGTAPGQPGSVPVLSPPRGEERRGEEKEDSPLTPHAADAAREGTRPKGWKGQWAGTRAAGQAPRQQAAKAAEAAPKPAKAPEPEPASPLWPALKAAGVGPAEFRRWIEPLQRGESDGGRVLLLAPTKFHASHVRKEFELALSKAIGAPVELRAAG